MSTYTPTIGLEVHAELNTVTKMFCGCKNDPHHPEPNVFVCPVCMAHPGTLPVVNAAAVEKVLRFGVAIGAEIATFTEFDRKNYFYPDIPKAYQISQYAYPLVRGGSINGVAITRVHLEEDTARSQHDKGKGSLVNYNRAGVPLLELVTEPVIKDAVTAGDFARELQLILRTLGISEAQMERGEMRVEANISVSPDDTFGTKVEVKNLNSFRSVEAAISYEVERHIRLLEAGETLVQETRGWDEGRQRTFSQRSKETAKDYRYFPDPDIPKFDTGQIAAFTPSRLAETLPELPAKKREKYSYIGLTSQQTETILQHPFLDSLYATLVSAHPEAVTELQVAANYLTSDGVSLLAEKGELPAQMSDDHFYQLIELVTSDQITSRTAKDLLAEVLYDDIDPYQVAAERKLLQMNDTDALLPIVDAVLAENETVVSDYKNGKESALQFLVGQGMKATKGAANPSTLASLFRDKLG